MYLRCLGHPDCTARHLGAIGGDRWCRWHRLWRAGGACLLVLGGTSFQDGGGLFAGRRRSEGLRTEPKVALVRHCVVQVNQGPVGAMPYRRKVLAVTLTSGQIPTF